MTCALIVGSFADGANETFTAGTGFTAVATQLVANLGSTYRTQWQEYKTVATTGTQVAAAASEFSQLAQHSANAQREVISPQANRVARAGEDGAEGADG